MPKSRSVLIVDLARYFGGADVRVLDMARALHGQRSYQVAALADGALAQRLLAEGLNLLPIPYKRQDLRIATDLRRAIRESGFDIVDAHNPQSQFWGQLAAASVRGTRLISTVHSAYRLEHNGSLKGRAYEQILKLNQMQGAHFIAVSEAVQAYLADIRIPAGRIHMIHNGIQVPPVKGQGRQHPLFQSLGWSADCIVVSSVGRLEEVKGHAMLIEAMGTLAGDYPQLRCVIVGDGRLREDLQNQISRLGLHERVHLAGFRDDILDLHEGSDIFCMPSYSEGLPYALLEASGRGLALILSEVGGMARLTKHEHNALLVPAGNSDGLGQAIRRLLDDPELRTRLKGAAQAWQRASFSIDTMLEQTLRIYDAD